MADVENERTEILCVSITIAISTYITRSLCVILVLLLHHVGVNYTTINMIASSVCVV